MKYDQSYNSKKNEIKKWKISMEKLKILFCDVSSLFLYENVCILFIRKN